MKFSLHSLVTLVCALVLGHSGFAQDLRMGAGQQGSQNYGVNAALAQALGEAGGLAVTVQSFGGPSAYLPLLQSKELDMAALVMPDVGDAIRGKGPFDGFPMDNLQLLASLFPSPVGLLVAADSGINSISDLRGQRVAWGLPAQASLLPYVEGALANGGLTRDDVELVPVTSVGAGVNELMSGRVDATLFALRAGKVVEADSALGGIRWLPFENTPAAVAAMQAIAPDAYLIEIKPTKGLLGVDTPIYTMAYDYALVVGAHLDSQVVNKVAQALYANAAAISASNRVLGSLNPANFLRDYPGLPYHPAAAENFSGQ